MDCNNICMYLMFGSAIVFAGLLVCFGVIQVKCWLDGRGD